MMTESSPPPGVDSSLLLNYGDWLPAKLDARILDVGCGDGRMLKFLNALGYHQITGLDRDSSALEGIPAMEGVSIEVQEVSADYFSQRQNSYDLIIIKQMIYYIPRQDALAFMEAISSSLAPNGLVIVEFFNGVLLSSRFTELKDPFILTAYTEHSMKGLILAAGLDVVYTGAEKRTYSGLRSQLYRCLRALWVMVLKAVLILERGIDHELPSHYSKSLLVVGRRRKAS